MTTPGTTRRGSMAGATATRLTDERRGHQIANLVISVHWDLGSVPPRTHRDHELTCGYAIGAA
jgi:hypothetical protein